MKKALFGGEWGELPNCENEPRVTIASGKAMGRLLGGNLSLVSSAVGTPYEFDAMDAILFLEDIGEQPYRIDGMLNHMLQAGSFEGCKGIVLGYYTDCAAENPDRSLTLREIFDEILKPLFRCWQALAAVMQNPRCRCRWAEWPKWMPMHRR